jgi:pimeloyl-ACP methyl ester carboxylesterase
MRSWTAEVCTIRVAVGELSAFILRPVQQRPHAAVLMLPAAGAPIADEDPTAKNFMGVLAEAGITSMHLVTPSAFLLEARVTAYRAALAALANQAAGSSLFLFGHSLGGVLAPVVAKDAPLEGVAVYGAPSRRWCDVLSDGARRQLALAGLDPTDLMREARCAANLYRMLLREGLSAVETLARDPELANCIAARDLGDDQLFGMSVALLRELDALDAAAAWREVRVPVLAMRGEHDWIVALDDHERIADWAPEAERCVVPGVDHDMQRHPSRRVSQARRGQGGMSDDVASVVAAWVKAHTRG